MHYNRTIRELPEKEVYLLLAQIRALFHYREAIRTMVRRDLTVRYSNSALGILWSLFNPLLMTAVYTLVFTFLFRNNIPHFPVFFLAGLLPWNFLVGTLLGSVSAIVGNGHLISRVYFPRDILPLATILANLVNFLLALVVLFALALLERIPLGLSLVALPIVILLQCGFSLGLGLFLAALNVHFRDAQQVVEVLVQAWFFLTPIIYPLDFIKTPDLRLLVKILNPMAALIESYRAILYAGQFPDWGVLGITTLQMLVLLVFGYWFFHKNSANFVEQL